MAGYTNYKHGLSITEISTALTPPIEVNSVTVAIGTSPLHLAEKPAEVYKPVLCSKLSDFQEKLGYSEDWEKYTLCEVAYSFFNLYNVSPVIFINVLDKSKHFTAVNNEEHSNVTTAEIILEGDIDIESIVLTSGESVAPTELVAGTDFEVEEIEYDDSDSDNVIEAAKVFKVLNGDKIVDNKLKVTYRLMSSALGGEAITSEVTISGTSFNLPTDTVIASVTATTGGVNTLQTLNVDEDYKVEYAGGQANITILSESKLVGDAVKVSYHVLKPELVTVNDIIGGIDAKGRATGLALIDSVYPSFSMTPTTLIAPKYSTEGIVASALASKAESVSGIFKAMAVVDLPTDEYPTASDAVSGKTQANLSSPFLIVCYPKVQSGSKTFYLSSHLAPLMNRLDAQNDNLPYQSPSNQTLIIDAAVLADGTEVYATQEQANMLNSVGIVTALMFSGWKAWGVESSVYPSNLDIKDRFISTRRMLNYLENSFVTRFLSQLDFPITRRAIDSILSSSNMWLSGLVARGALIGGNFALSSDMTVADLLDGHLRFDLTYASSPPAKAISVQITYDTDYLEALLS